MYIFSFSFFLNFLIIHPRSAMKGRDRDRDKERGKEKERKEGKKKRRKEGRKKETRKAKNETKQKLLFLCFHNFWKFVLSFESSVVFELCP